MIKSGLNSRKVVCLFGACPTMKSVNNKVVYGLLWWASSSGCQAFQIAWDLVRHILWDLIIILNNWEWKRGGALLCYVHFIDNQRSLLGKHAWHEEQWNAPFFDSEYFFTSGENCEEKSSRDNWQGRRGTMAKRAWGALVLNDACAKCACLCKMFNSHNSAGFQ